MSNKNLPPEDQTRLTLLLIIITVTVLVMVVFAIAGTVNFLQFLGFQL